MICIQPERNSADQHISDHECSIYHDTVKLVGLITSKNIHMQYKYLKNLDAFFFTFYVLHGGLNMP